MPAIDIYRDLGRLSEELNTKESLRNKTDNPDSKSSTLYPSMLALSRAIEKVTSECTYFPGRGVTISEDNVISVTGGVASYQHVQATPSDTWRITHNLGYNPQVTVIDTDGARGWPKIVYPDKNTAVALFNMPVAGFASLV